MYLCKQDFIYLYVHIPLLKKIFIIRLLKEPNEIKAPKYKHLLFLIIKMNKISVGESWSHAFIQCYDVEMMHNDPVTIEKGQDCTTNITKTFLTAKTTEILQKIYK